MAKFNKKALPRGVKLYADKATQTQVDVASALSNKDINEENLKNPSIPWRMTLAPVVFEAKTFVTPQMALPFPFTLPPPQELWSDTGEQAYNQVSLVLDELSFWADTRGESCILGSTAGGADGPSMNAAVQYSQIEITIVEKQQWFFNMTMDTHVPEKVLFKTTITDVDFASLNFPIQQTNINLQLSPYKTYAVQVACPFLNSNNNVAGGASGTDFLISNPIISLKGKWVRLPNTIVTTEPDDDDPELANAPTRGTEAPADTVSVTVPAGGSTIDATTINTNLETLDAKLFEGIQGGYGPNSELPAYQHIKETMGYDIIAVPLLVTDRLNGFRTDPTFGNHESFSPNNAPYFVAGAPNFMYDRFILPVAFPMEVHHVFCSWSLISPAEDLVAGYGVGTHPTAITTRWQVGVSMGSGIKSDWVANSQIAALEWSVDPADPTFYQNYLIDRYRVKEFGTYKNVPLPAIMSAGGPTDPKWDVALLQVPLMSYVGGQRGNGYYPQGKPVFVGRGNSYTGGRDLGAPANTIDNARRTKLPDWSAVNNPVWEAPANGFSDVRGLENFIEVAVKIEDSAGLENGAGVITDVLSGHGGLWVYLVVKRTGVASSERLR